MAAARPKREKQTAEAKNEKKKPPCYSYMGGFCRYGDTCHYSHEDQKKSHYSHEDQKKTETKDVESTDVTRNETGDPSNDEEQNIDRMISELMAMKTARAKGKMAVQAEHPYMHGRSVKDGGAGAGGLNPGIYQPNQSNGFLGMAQRFQDANGDSAYYDSWKDS